MYKTFIKPLLDTLDHETAQHSTTSLLHNLETNPLTLKILETIGAEKGKRFTHPKLRTTVAGITFDNPVLLAAGWDRDGKAVRAMHQLGFGGVEIGTVTAYPQPGNARPRLHLLDKDVALNHFGFSGPGMEAVAQNLERYKNSGIPIGISVTKNKYVTATGAAPLYAVVVRRLYEYGSYFVLNVSSPNTVGLKVLQQKNFLTEIVKEVISMMEDIGEKKPIFIKIAPDIPYKTLDDVIDIVMDNKLAGIIAVNTFPHTNTIAKYGISWEDRQGGLSGNDKHYRNIGTRYLAYIHNQTQGKVTTIGVGGIHDTQTALEKIAAGATLVQTFTGLIAEGPTLPGKINRGIVAYMEKAGIKSLDEIRGAEAKTIWESKYSYSFAIHNNQHTLETLKKEYLSALFQKNTYDTLLISNKPFTLKHGELGRTWSRIYLNHRIPLFTHLEYRKLFGRIMDTLIREKLLENGQENYGVLSIPTSGSPELTNLVHQFSDRQISRAIVVSKFIHKVEKGVHPLIYGSLTDDKQWILLDDVFTSGKTIKETLKQLKESKNLPKALASASLVVRNKEMLDSFEKQTGQKIISFVTLDEILQYHWGSFSAQEKKIIKGERITLH